jgi:hypothetical protein
MNVIDEPIRRAAGRNLPVLQGPVAPTRLDGLDGGRHAPHQPEPVDMDMLIRARAGKESQPIGYAPNGIPLTVD